MVKFEICSRGAENGMQRCPLDADHGGIRRSAPFPAVREHWPRQWRPRRGGRTPFSPLKLLAAQWGFPGYSPSRPRRPWRRCRGDLKHGCGQLRSQALLGEGLHHGRRSVAAIALEPCCARADSRRLHCMPHTPRGGTRSRASHSCARSKTHRAPARFAWRVGRVA